MSSCKKPEIQSDLPKITKIKGFFFFFNKHWSKIPSYVYVIMF